LRITFAPNLFFNYFHNTARSSALKQPLQRVTDNLSKVDKIALFWSSLTQGLDAIWKSITNITWADVGNFALAMVNPVEFYNTVSGAVKGIWTELSDWGGFEKDPVGMILKKGSNVGVQLLTICGVITGLLLVLSIAATVGSFFTAGALIPLTTWLWSATATMGSVTIWVGVITAALSVLSGIKNAYEMHSAKTAEVLFQNNAELKKDAGNTAIAILAIVGGKGQVSGAKQMLEMLKKYPKTFAKRMFIELKKNFMRKLLWAPRTVAAMFKKDTWKNLYASLRRYLSRNSDELAEEQPNRDLKNDPVKENVDDKKSGTNEPREKPDKVTKEPTVEDKKASENYKKHENDVDDAEKKKLKKDADDDVPDGPDSDSKRRALFMAKVITEANDKVDTPAAGLIAELMPLKAMKGVKGFDAKKDELTGTHDIVMYGSKFNIKKDYTEKGDGKEGASTVGQASRSIKEQLSSKREAIVRVNSKEDAETLLRDFISGDEHIGSYMDTTQEFTFHPQKSASDYLPRPSSRKRGTYHWDDFNPSAKIGDHAIQGAHLQIHTFEGFVVRIFF
jgi:hypothetical protein